MPAVATARHVQLAQELRQLLTHWSEGRDLVEIGAYKPGTNPGLDRALGLLPAIDAFLGQGVDETSSLEETVALLEALLARGD